MLRSGRTGTRLVQTIRGVTKQRMHFFFSPEPQMAEFPPYYKPPYAWETLPSPFDFRQLGFHSSLLQHANNLYRSEFKQSPEDQQPLDCSTHYSPTSDTYHCITCDKVNYRSGFYLKIQILSDEENGKHFVKKLKNNFVTQNHLGC